MKQNPTVFLIDDDTDDQEIFSFALEKTGKSVTCVFANDGLHALEKIKADETLIPDFIFMDLNMPRMNGKQCLAEIKKIERLKHVPVFMYSTSADPESVVENMKLGAEDFIVKPSDINVLIEILSGILKRRVIPFLIFLFFLSMLPFRSPGQTDSIPAVKDLKKLSVEELMNIVVTSVSKSPERLTEVASAVQVITGEEIKRSGTLRLPGALRLATNVQVISAGAHDTRVSTRGFSGFPISNSSLADKLLVLIDGRSVYTPLFGGVFWDVQNVLQEDIKQIEVISGPGGTLWGANAVNGIINVISKSAKETEGLYVTGASGPQLPGFGAIRYGSHIDTSLFFRVYAQHYDFSSSTLIGGIKGKDEWNITQGGFRMDFLPSAENTFTLQGDVYAGDEDEEPSTLVNGQNIIGRWTHAFSDHSGLTVQSYVDHAYRNIKKQGFIDEITTYDLDAQHNFSIGSRNRIVWGLGYRAADDNINTVLNDFVPARRTLQLLSGFAQEQFALIPERLELTVGSKFLRNDYTEFEYQPTVRLASTPNEKHTVWAAVSRAVRTPTRLETDHPSTGLGSLGYFKSEKVIAYELGYRVHPMENLSFSLATYYNQYTDLRSLDSNHTPPPAFSFANNLEANTYGAEFSANVIVSTWWKLRGGYTYLHESFTTTDPATFPQSDLLEAVDPKNQALIQSIMNVAKHFEVDAVLRYVDIIPAAFNVAAVPSYITFDLRLAWKYKWLTASVVGQNLGQASRASGSLLIQRSMYGRLTLNF